MRLKRLAWTYKDCPVYYLTLVSHDRKRLFANDLVHTAFKDFGKNAIHHGVTVGQYVLMPDHIHLFAAFSAEAISVSVCVKSLKNTLSKCLRSNNIASPHWQKGFFDHVLRSDEAYVQKWEYVRHNPVRAGLVASVDIWEFQGEVYALEFSR